MKLLILTVLLVLGQSEGVRYYRGAVPQSYAAPASLAYTKLQQPVQKLQADPQQYLQAQVKYAQAPAPQAYSFPQQLQYEQPLTYAQPAAASAPKYAPAPAQQLTKVALRPQQYSLANDVSSFTYSSPVVTYNNLGLLTQVVGKAAAGSVQTKSAPVAYQQPLQKAVYAQPAPVTYAAPARLAVQQKTVPTPQQYLTQIPQQFAQQYVAAPAQQQAYSAQQQAYSAQQQAYSGQQQAYSAQPTLAQQTYSAPQSYAAQSIPQEVYAPAPQYYSSQQVKQASPGVAYAH